jgi:hypothetical protein
MLQQTVHTQTAVLNVAADGTYSNCCAAQQTVHTVTAVLHRSCQHGFFSAHEKGDRPEVVKVKCFSSQVI